MDEHQGIGNPSTIYETFRDPRGQIRIANIQPGHECDPISCTLEIYELDNVPNFEALSYVWGEEKNLQPIKLQGADWEVTPDLHAALLALRKRWEPRRMWIDAICINQRNNHEKGSQVSLMAEIYQNAVQVIAWLGEEIENFEGAARLMKTIPKILPSAPDYWPNFFDVDELDEDWKYVLNSSHLWDAIFELFTRPYWSRLWVLQEYILSRLTLLQCGHHMIDNQSVANFLTKLNGLQRYLIENHIMKVHEETSLKSMWRAVKVLNGPIIMLFPLIADINLRGGFALCGEDSDRYHSLITFVELSRCTRPLVCRDPRDRIYALLGLLALHKSENILMI